MAAETGQNAGSRPIVAGPAGAAGPRVARLAGMRITVLAGGVGAARFLRGLKSAAPGAEITVIGNTGDDISLFGLNVSPDLDTVMYTLGGGIDEEQGWGRAGDTYTVLAELSAYGAGPDWFSLGDRDIATHLHRTSMLGAGLPLSAVTGILCRRWQPGATTSPPSPAAARRSWRATTCGRATGQTSARERELLPAARG